jgi:hypothetical protein
LESLPEFVQALTFAHFRQLQVEAVDGAAEIKQRQRWDTVALIEEVQSRYVTRSTTPLNGRTRSLSAVDEEVKQSRRPKKSIWEQGTARMKENNEKVI